MQSLYVQGNPQLGFNNGLICSSTQNAKIRFGFAFVFGFESKVVFQTASCWKVIIVVIIIIQHGYEGRGRYRR